MAVIYPQTSNEWLQSQVPAAQQATSKVKFQGITENISGALVNIPVVYGYRRVTGPRVYTRTKNSDSNVLYTVIVVSDGRIGKFDKIYINDIAYNISSVLSNVRYTLTSGIYSNLIEIQPFFGDTTNVISSLLTESTNNSQDFRALTDSLSGMAYCVVKLIYNPSGSPFDEFPKISFDICGRRLRPADTLGAEVSVLQDANPADVLLDYLTNNVYGRGLADSKIDTVSLTALRNSFEQTVTSYVNGPSIKRATCNFVLDTSNSVLENVRDICRQFGIIMTLANGKYRFVPEYSSDTYVLTVDKSNLIDGYSESIPDLSVKYNKVSVTFPDERFGNVDSTEIYQVTSDQTNDGKILDVNMRLDAITNPYRARFMAEQIYRKSRTQRLYKFRMTKIALRLTVGDLVQWDPESSGSTNTVLRVITMTLNDDFTFDIEAITHRNDNYPPFTPGNRVPTRQELQPSPSGLVDNLSSFGLSQPINIVYPVSKPGNDVATITVTNSGKPGWTTEPPKLGGSIGINWYRGPVTKINPTDTTINSSNYQLDNLNFSINNSDSNFGVDPRINRVRAGTTDIIWAEWRPIITFRQRDAARQGGEGVFEYGSRTYTKIFYAYEFERINGIPQYGVMNRTGDRNNFERYILDPDNGGNTATEINPNGIRSEVTVKSCLEGRTYNQESFRSLYGFPFLEYLSDGYYGLSINGSGIKYQLKNFHLVGTNDTYVMGNSSWGIRQSPATGTDQLTTLKFFILKPDGYVTTIGTMNININSARFADSGLASGFVSTSRSNWYRLFPQTSFGLAPF